MVASKYFPRGAALDNIGTITEHRSSGDIIWSRPDPKVGRWYNQEQPNYYMTTGQLMNRFHLRRGCGDSYDVA